MRKASTRPGKGPWRAPDQVRRKFAVSAINRPWYGDGTEIRTGQGKLYLDSVLDVGSRRILGHALGTRHDAELPAGRWSWRPPSAAGTWPAWSSTATVSMGGPVVPGVLTRTAADARGCWCQAAPGLPDPHFRLTGVLSFPGYVGCPGAPGEAPRLAGGVT